MRIHVHFHAQKDIYAKHVCDHFRICTFVMDFKIVSETKKREKCEEFIHHKLYSPERRIFVDKIKLGLANMKKKRFRKK